QPALLSQVHHVRARRARRPLHADQADVAQRLEDVADLRLGPEREVLPPLRHLAGDAVAVLLERRELVDMAQYKRRVESDLARERREKPELGHAAAAT